MVTMEKREVKEFGGGITGFANNSPVFAERQERISNTAVSNSLKREDQVWKEDSEFGVGYLIFRCMWEV